VYVFPFFPPGVVVQVLIQSVGRQFDDSAAPLDQQLPVLIKISRAGQPTPHADDG
jgi:hypothetical protein